MARKFLVLISLFAMLALSGTALAQGNTPQHSDPAWHAAFWNNMTLSGSPVLERSDAAIDFDWGGGSPGAGVNADGFSARWSRYLDLPAGTYRFSTSSDDGLRVYVDGSLILDLWYDHPPLAMSADRALGAGHHLVVVEFYENTGGAVARVSWAPVSPPIANWRGAYFANRNLSGSPALVRDDVQIQFAWGSGSPQPGVIPADGFSVRWTRSLNLEAGTYHFSMTVDDGARLWVNNHLLIDAWRDQAPRTYTGEIYLPGGAVPIKMEYYENTGGATAKLVWSKGSVPPPPPSSGTVIVDDGDAGFVKGGRAAGWRTEAEGYNNDLTWTQNNDWQRLDYNWARWYPKLTARRYEVLVYIPDRYTTTSAARYWVSHADGYTLRIVNQSTHGGQWVSLGTYRFRGTDKDYVSLADVTYEPYLSRLIAWDAVKWVPR